MVHSDSFWNDLELQEKINENDVPKACIVVVFQTIWNCKEIDESNVSKACILTGFETIWTSDFFRKRCL